MPATPAPETEDSMPHPNTVLASIRKDALPTDAARHRIECASKFRQLTMHKKSGVRSSRLPLSGAPKAPSMEPGGQSGFPNPASAKPPISMHKFSDQRACRPIGNRQSEFGNDALPMHKISPEPAQSTPQKPRLVC